MARISNGRFNLAIDRGCLLPLAGLTLLIVTLRLPSFFEPPWHTDEGIFAAVAYKVLQGGSLYAEAWESKPPLFLLLYAAIFKLFGVGVLPLRIAALLFATGTLWAVFGVACRLMSRRKALLAAGLCGVLISVPFWEGNLALTETFTLLPTVLGMLCCLVWEQQARRRTSSLRLLLLAGMLFGIAMLVRQTAAVACGAFVLWLLLSGRPWLRPALALAAGGAAVITPVVLWFALFGSFHWFWDANVGFFFLYIPSGEQIPFHYRPLIVLPVFVAAAATYRYHQRGESPAWTLPALWLTSTLAAALLTGRPYSHYFLQTLPPLSLLVLLTLPALRLRLPSRALPLPALALSVSLLALWLGVVRPEFEGNLLARHYTKSLDYYTNFVAWAAGEKSRTEYNDYFDRRVNLTLQLDGVLERLGARGRSLYVWGEYPWLYALAGAEPATRYTTSFYVLLIPGLDTSLEETLAASNPAYIVRLTDARVSMVETNPVIARRYENATAELNDLLQRRYEPVAVAGKATVFRRVYGKPRPPAELADDPDLESGQDPLATMLSEHSF